MKDTDDVREKPGDSLKDELHLLDAETFEVADLTEIGQDMASWTSSSCSTSSCCSCSTSSCCSCSTSSGSCN